MNKLNQIRGLIERLTVLEINTLKQNFKKNNNDDRSKSHLLLEVISGNQFRNAQDIQKVIYGKSNYQAFNKLLNRFEGKIFECLILDKNLSQKNVYSKRNSTYFNLRKQLVCADILQLRGDRFYSDKLYRKIIKDSKKLEFYDVELQALLSFERLKNLFNKRHKSLEKSINESQNCWALLNQSRSEYNKIISVLTNERVKKDYNVILENSLKLLKNNYSCTGSPTIGFYFHTLNIEFEQNRKNYQLADKSLQDLNNLLLKHDSVYTDNRYGTFLINKANNDLFLHKYSEAITYAKEAKKYFKGHKVTNLLVNEILFLAHFNHKDFNQCSLIIDESKNISFSINPVMYNKFLYYEACLNFGLGNFKSTIDILSESNKFEFEKGDYFIMAKILQIMALVEFKEQGAVDSLYEAIDKYFKRNKRYFSNSKRVETIVKLIRLFLRYNFDIKNIARLNVYKKLINGLLDSKGDMSWEAKSYEVIPFHEWLHTIS